MSHTRCARLTALLFLATALAAALLAMPEPAYAADGVFIAAPSRRGMVYDDARHILYVANADRVLRFDVVSKTFLDPFIVGGDLRGIDLSPDGSTLAVGDATAPGGIGLPDATRTGWIHLVDAVTGVDQKLTYQRLSHEGGSFAVAFGADGRVLSTSEVVGYLRRNDPGDLTSQWLFAVKEETMLSPSGDRNVIAYIESHTSAGSWGSYRVSDGADTAGQWMDDYVFDIAVNRDGSMYAAPASGGIITFGSDLQGTGGVVGAFTGAAFNPLGEIIYGSVAGTSLVRGYDIESTEIRREFDVGSTFDQVADPSPLMEGHIKTSADGTRVFVLVDGGVRMIELNSVLSGHVYDDETGAPLSGIRVRVFDAESVWDGTSVLVTETVTAADGSWSCAELGDKYHVVAFSDPTSTYRDLTFPGSGVPLDWSWAYNPVTRALPMEVRLPRLSTLLQSRVFRVAGADRYQTALEISEVNFASADTAIVVSGQSFADALSASPLAGVLEAPVLLTGSATPPPGLVTELKRLGVKEILVVGGTSVVSEGLLSALTSAGLPKPTRIAGKNRYDTSALVANRVLSITGYGLEPFICRGDAFPDALSASPFAYMEGRPILLVQPNALPSTVAATWRTMCSYCDSTAIVMGGTASVSDDVIMQLAEASPFYEVNYFRIAGADRYETCQTLIEAYGWPFDAFGVASGASFPDALSGGAACGRMGVPVLLTRPDSLVSPAREVLLANASYVLRVEVFGGLSALSAGVLDGAKEALGNRFYDLDDADGYVEVASLGPVSVSPGPQDMSFGATNRFRAAVRPGELKMHARLHSLSAD